MLVPSVDTHTYEQLSKRLSVVLKEGPLVNQALANIDEEARTSFVNSFCGPKPKKMVRVSYEYPMQHEASEAVYVIQLGGGSENIKSIGGIEGNFEYKNTGVKRERSVIRVDDANPDRMVIPLTNPIADIEAIPEISFSVDDEVVVTDYEISFNRDDTLQGLEVEIIYSTKDIEAPRDIAGVDKGFTSTETVTVIPLSYNYDTVRCLDALLKAILITMRESIPEKVEYSLQTVTYSPIQNVIPDAERPVFGRPHSISYKVSYGIDFDFYRKVNEILLIKKGGKRVGWKDKK